MADAPSAEPDFWPHQGPVAERGGPSFADVIDELRRVQNQLMTARLPPDVAISVRAGLHDIADTLAAHRVDAEDAAAGARTDLPGRGHPFLPPLIVDEWTDGEVHAHVTLTDYFAGRNGAAAGGLGVMFSDVLGRLSFCGGRSVSRAAYVHVNYRDAIPVGQRLELHATLDRIDGRKRFISGRLSNGEVLVADAEGLFLELRPQ